MVPANKNATPLEGGCSTKIGGMWNLKHEISSPKFYEILINIELNGSIDMDLKNFYNRINMYLNAETRLLEDLLPTYQSTKIHSDLEEYFAPDCDDPYYSWNDQTYTSLGHSLLVALTNDTCVKFSTAPQDHKVVNTYAHEISG